ncbi:helix-turn-helix domain containing protein [Amycolatopsis cynarae]|uniref:Helix-turn-helix domain containing protein n=1 Tax=Amycolatopsis cynarae TaxID=2995223 RepID=A0ABY7AYP5_9PSEU|nr:TetR/AcrR family transcriptional regulator [Amycolatopsis sp. HUAS 11-8]WAL63728.1 helix-turn-helix domain containing protein [Amycolatopsis sp. HUAS 11-8]
MSAVERLLAADSPRADARRNMQRLVDAARAAIAEVGVDVTAHEIARRAGVGIGTFYRRLPSREALLEAVLDDLLAEMTGLADRAMTEPDPWRGFRTFAEDYVRLRATSCGINDALGGCPLNLDGPLARVRERLSALVRRAQDAGVFRADVTWQDVAFLLAGVLPGDHTLGLPAPEGQWRRTLGIALDGLRENPTCPPEDLG